jgi:hypothetical protein
MNSKRSRPGPALAAALLGFAAVAAAFYFKPLPALEDKSLLRSDGSVSVASGPAGILFAPRRRRKPPESSFIAGSAFLPRPMPTSRIPARRPATRPSSHLCRSTFHVLAPSKATAAAAAAPGVARWVIAGHSQGGAAAASFALSTPLPRSPCPVAGLIFFASFPGKGVDLSTKSLPVVTVGATLDALASPAEIAAGRDRLPAGSRYVEIAGGNHAQFGEYGPQSGDGLAEIPGPTQRKAAVDEAIAFLDGLDAGAGK